MKVIAGSGGAATGMTGVVSADAVSVDGLMAAVALIVGAIRRLALSCAGAGPGNTCESTWVAADGATGGGLDASAISLFFITGEDVTSADDTAVDTEALACGSGLIGTGAGLSTCRVAGAPAGIKGSVDTVAW